MPQEQEFSIRVPCSSANIGPGFDVIGLALDIFLDLHITSDSTGSPEAIPKCLQLTYEGDGADQVSLDPEVNLVTRVALYVLRCEGVRDLPRTLIRLVNAIPLGRGLGSSGAAVVAGVTLANELGGLKLPKARLLDYCLMVERHPDNVAAALYGGLVATYLNELDPSEASRLEIPLSEVLPEPAGGIDTGLQPPTPPRNIGFYHQFPWAPSIRCIAVIPDFEVATAKARAVLPQVYSRADLVFNLQRMALLPAALGQDPPDPKVIHRAMQDRIHQPYRGTLVPALADVLRLATPDHHPGLLGACLSGAGPTVLILATANFDAIAHAVLDIFANAGVQCRWQLLQPAHQGTVVTRHTKSL